MTRYPIFAVNPLLRSKHYLGEARRGFALVSPEGVMVFANPSSRRLPQKSWLELIRWCITSGKNAGSQQWSMAAKWITSNLPDITTVVSYSDPSHGHTGALYRACNWLWAPTWHRLRPPPSGNGQWTSRKQESVKDRWVFVLKEDAARQTLLAVNDSSVTKRKPWASYREPRKNHPGGGDYKRWVESLRTP